YMSDIIDIMNSVGLNISGAEEHEFNNAFIESSKDETKQDKITGLVTASIDMGDNKCRAMIPLVNTYTIQILYRLGFKWPLISDEYLIMFIKYLKEMNFFD
ncbi:MAG: hypothetical protein WCF28_00050, partial [Methanobacterium sp.]|uniref:hypothetical protein n=1 Tax=Methanobacterium sp. TaxID=2164 RepID=UPI003C7450B1